MPLVAIVDIGSTSVGAALALMPRRQRAGHQVCASIIFSTRNEINFPEHDIDPNRFLEGIAVALKKTMLDVVKAGKGAPERVEVFLSAPFYASQTRAVRKQAAEPFVITPALIKELTAVEVADHATIESELLGIRANGYQLRNPYKQPALDLEVQHFLSLAAPEIIKRFSSVIEGAVHHSRVRFHTFAYVFYRVLQLALPHQHNLLVLDIGGEISELSLLWHGVLRETISFPFGRNWLLRNVAARIGATPAAAYSAVKLSLAGTRQAQDPRFDQALTAVRNEWLTSFRSALNKLLECCFIPERGIAVGDPNIIPLFRRWLEAEELPAVNLGNKRLAIAQLNESVFDAWCDHSADVHRDFSLIVESIFCDKILGAN